MKVEMSGETVSRGCVNGADRDGEPGTGRGSGKTPETVDGKQKRLRLDEARDLLRRQLRRCVVAETVPLGAALHRVLAEDLVAAVDLPSQDKAAVDGYAVRSADLTADQATRLRVIGQSAAGHPWPMLAEPFQAVRIFTGAAVPTGLDTVIMQEACGIDGGVVAVPAGMVVGANIRRCGEDYATGQLALHQGLRLRPRDLGLAAALGVPVLRVYRRLRVALFSTGDELLDPGSSLQFGQAWDANRHLLTGQLTELGCEVSDFGILPDRLTKTIGALADAAHDHDLIVTSGGMSVGDEDYVKRVIRRRGHLELWQLAIKPGKPVGFGDIDDCPILALPGNPVAALATFTMLGTLAVARLSGSDDDLPSALEITADFTLSKQPGRREFLPGVLGQGARSVGLFAKKGSAMISALVGSDGLIDLAEDTTGVVPGDRVRFIPFRQPGF